MKLLFILGNSSLEKMAVGQELVRITGHRIFYNHMTIEPKLDVFTNLQIFIKN